MDLELEARRVVALFERRKREHRAGAYAPRHSNYDLGLRRGLNERAAIDEAIARETVPDGWDYHVDHMVGGDSVLSLRQYTPPGGGAR